MPNTIGFIGGTGPEGKGLAARFARAGMRVIIGSRSAERGEEVAREVAALSGGQVSGATNEEAARQADLVVLTIPYAGQAETLTALTDAIGTKVVVTAVVPLQFSRGRISMLEVEDGSAGQEAQRLLPEARVVGAFHNLAAGLLLDLDHDLDGDVLVCGDDAEAVAEVIQLAQSIKNLRGVTSGPLSSSHFIEGITALLITINRIHKTEAHVRILGV